MWHKVEKSKHINESHQGSAHNIYAMRRKNTAPGRKDGNLKDLVKVSFRLSEACMYLLVYLPTCGVARLLST